jgi:hypothetical protein
MCSYAPLRTPTDYGRMDGLETKFISKIAVIAHLQTKLVAWLAHDKLVGCT